MKIIRPFLIYACLSAALFGCDSDKNASSPTQATDQEAKASISRQDVDASISQYNKALIKKYIEAGALESDRQLGQVLKQIQSEDDPELLAYFLHKGLDNTSINKVYPSPRSFFISALERDKSRLYQFMIQQHIEGKLVLTEQETGAYLSRHLEGKTNEPFDITRFDKLITTLPTVNIQDSDGKSLLALSIAHNREEATGYLLDKGIDINLKDSDGTTALMLAASRNDATLFKRLIGLGADVKAIDNGYYSNPTEEDILLYGRSALNHAVFFASMDILRLYPEPEHYRRDPPSRLPTPLMRAAELHHQEMSGFFLDMGMDINEMDEEGNTAINYAARSYIDKSMRTKNKGFPVMDLLIDKGAKLNPKSALSPLTWAIALNYPELLDHLVKRGGKLNKDVIYAGLDGGHPFTEITPGMLDMLFRYKLDINHENSDGLTMLNHAISANNVAAAKYLIDKGTNIKSNPSYLRQVIGESRYEIAYLLAERGLNPNLVDSDGVPLIFEILSEPTWDYKDAKGPKDYNTSKTHGHEFLNRLAKDLDIELKHPNGDTLLHALMRGHANMDIAKLLLKRKIDVNQPGLNGETALHILGKRRIVDTMLMRLLIESGANVNAQDKDGDTPLHVMMRRSGLATVHLLLAHGADIHKKNNKGVSASDLIEKDRRASALIKLLDNPGSGTQENDFDSLRRDIALSGNCYIASISDQDKTTFQCLSKRSSALITLRKDAHEKGDILTTFNLHLENTALASLGKEERHLDPVLQGHDEATTAALRKWFYSNLQQLDASQPKYIFLKGNTTLELKHSDGYKDSVDVDVMLIVEKQAT